MSQNKTESMKNTNMYSDSCCQTSDEAIRFLSHTPSPLKMKRAFFLQECDALHIERRMVRGNRYNNRDLLIKRYKKNTFLDEVVEETLDVNVPTFISEERPLEKTVKLDVIVDEEENEEEEEILLDTFKLRFSSPFKAMDLALLQDVKHMKVYVQRYYRKYAISALVFSLAIANQLNQNPFGFARMTFSQGSWLWLRIALLGTLSELLMIVLVSLSNKAMNYKRSIVVQSCSCATSCIALTAANFSMFYSPTIWLFLFSLAIIYGAMARLIALKKAYRLSDEQGVKAVLLSYVYVFLLFTLWYGLVGQDISRIIHCFIKY